MPIVYTLFKEKKVSLQGTNKITGKQRELMNERYLLDQLKQGNKEAFSLLFSAYYKNLVLFGGNFLPDRYTCEDIVQSVFLKLWRDRKVLVIESSLKSYLLNSIRNSCLDEIRHRNVMTEHESYMYASGVLYDWDTENYVLYSDLRKHLDEALKQLPETYRKAFELNRFEGLKYREIAQKLKVSERTVEVRIGKAIELLRKYLQDFLAWLILFFLH
jgi:RNA polymerase sigma-70 factor (ECF subfamily)